MLRAQRASSLTIPQDRSSTAVRSKTIVNTGRFATLWCSRLSNRLAVAPPDSLPISIQPKLVEGSSSQP